MQSLATSERSRLHSFPGNQVENGYNQVNQDNSFLSGIKQRLLSFIFQGMWNEETDQTVVGLSLFTLCYFFWPQRYLRSLSRSILAHYPVIYM